MARKKKRDPASLQELLAYMRTLRRRGQENYLLGKLAPGERAESVVEFILEHGYKTTLKEKVDTIVVSDIHFGSKHSLADALRAALSNFEFNRLILNGDIFDSLEIDIDSLRESHKAFLRDLCALSQTREVVWIQGNHDDGLESILGRIVAARVRKEYEWEYNGKRYLALHGDQFDAVYKDNPVLYEIGSQFYTFVQSLGPWTRGFCAWLKRKTKLYTKAIALSLQLAVEYAEKRGVDYVICGHTHNALQHKGTVNYLNSGGWTETPCHLITVSEKGVRAHAFNEKGEFLGIAFAS